MDNPVVTGINLLFEVMKQLITVETALIAFIGTLLGVIYKGRPIRFTWLCIFCMVGFFVSIYYGLSFMTSLSGAVLDNKLAIQSVRDNLNGLYNFSLRSFYVSLVLLGGFISINLYKPQEENEHHGLQENKTGSV